MDSAASEQHLVTKGCVGYPIPLKRTIQLRGRPPHTYPTPEGGIQMEWSFGANACVLTINLETRKADWTPIGEGAQTKDELTLDLDYPGSWARIAEMVSGRSDAKVDGMKPWHLTLPRCQHRLCPSRLDHPASVPAPTVTRTVASCV